MVHDEASPQSTPSLQAPLAQFTWQGMPAGQLSPVQRSSAGQSISQAPSPLQTPLAAMQSAGMQGGSPAPPAPASPGAPAAGGMPPLPAVVAPPEPAVPPLP